MIGKHAFSLLCCALLVMSGGVVCSQGLTGSEWQDIPVWAANGTPNHSIQDLESFDNGSGRALYVAGVAEGPWPALTVVTWGATVPAGFNGICGAFPPCFGPRIDDLHVYDDGTGSALYVVRDWPMGGVVRFPANGSLGTQVGGTVIGMNVVHGHDDGSGPSLFAGGSFVLPTASFIGRWNGTIWAPLGSGLNGPVACMEVWDDGSGPALYVGGAFTLAGGQPAGGIAKWDGVAWSPLGSGVAGGIGLVSVLEVFDDGAGPVLFAGGSFQTAGGVVANGLARWDGQAWSGLGGGFAGGSPTTLIADLIGFDDGTGERLHAGGSFTTAGGVQASNIAVWDGATWAPVAGGLGAGPTEGVTALGVQSDLGGLPLFPPRPSLFAAGNFSTVGGAPSTGLARVSRIAVQLGQSGPGQYVYVFNQDLVPGREYFNLFSPQICAGPPGGGPWLGLCASTPNALQFLIDQVTSPLNTYPFHQVATSAYGTPGAYLLPPVTLDVVCFEASGGVIGRVADQVFRFTVQ